MKFLKFLAPLFIGLFLIPFSTFANFDRNLSYGMKGDDVKELQEFLISENLYSGPITGNFYSLTLKAVKAFQAREGIKPSAGFFGAVTRTRANTLLDTKIQASNNQAVGEGAPVISPTPTPTPTPEPTPAPVPSFIVDFCSNLEGAQLQLPVGYYRNSDNNCYLKIVEPTPTPTPTNSHTLSIGVTESNKKINNNTQGISGNIVYSFYNDSYETIDITTIDMAIGLKEGNFGSNASFSLNSTESGIKTEHANFYITDDRNSSVFTLLLANPIHIQSYGYKTVDLDFSGLNPIDSYSCPILKNRISNLSSLTPYIKFNGSPVTSILRVDRSLENRPCYY